MSQQGLRREGVWLEPESGCSECLLKLGAAERGGKMLPRDPGHLLPNSISPDRAALVESGAQGRRR